MLDPVSTSLVKSFSRKTIMQRVVTNSTMAISIPSGWCVSLGAVALFLCSPVFAQDGTELLHRMQQALGGADKIASIRDVDELVHAQTWHEDGSIRGMCGSGLV